MSEQLTLFKSRAPIMGYVFRSGRTIHFSNGLFATANQAEIDELNEVCQDSPCFYIDSGQKTIDSTQLNPVDMLREQLRKELLQEMGAAGDKSRDLGNTPQPDGKLKGIGNTVTAAADAAVSGSAQETVAKPALTDVLANITVGKPSAKE